MLQWKYKNVFGVPFMASTDWAKKNGTLQGEAK
jgi:hypothetical protein